MLRDKDPKTLVDAYKIAVNIENNRRGFGKLGRRDDPKLFNPRGSGTKEGDRSSRSKKPEDDRMDQVLTMLKGLKPPTTTIAKVQSNDKP